jgi:hypothetical protein
LGNNSGPSQRGHKPLPECLTRLLRPPTLNGSPIRFADPVVHHGYMRAVAGIWLQLDRLDEFIDVMTGPSQRA